MGLLKFRFNVKNLTTVINVWYKQQGPGGWENLKGLRPALTSDIIWFQNVAYRLNQNL